MTDFLNTLNFNIRITGVKGIPFDSRLRQNIKKSIGNIVYLESPPTDAVKLAYVGTMAMSSARDLYIGDRSDELYGNSRTGTVSEFISPTNPIAVANDNFLVTQVFNYVDSGDIPLYFKYVFSESFDSIVKNSIRLYDKDFNEVSSDKYKLELVYNYDESTGNPTTPSHYELYNSLESYYDAVTGNFAVYFLQFTDNSGSIEITKTILLENEKAYNKATYADVWPDTGDLKPWAKVYSTQDDTGGVTVTMSDSKATSVRYEETRRVRVYGPAETSNESAWYLRVVNGSFNSGYEGYSMSYRIPEFSNQAFNPIEPYKLSVSSPSDKIADGLIKLPNQDLVFGSLFSSLYIVIHSDEDTAIYAITNDRTKDGTDYINFEGERIYDENNETIKWSTDLLLGVDKLSGIVQVDLDLKDSYKIYSTYSFEEATFLINSLNMNPIYDTAAAKETKVIYLVPNNCPTNPNPDGQTAAVRWLKVSPSGKIVASNQNSSGGNTRIDSDTKLTDSDGYSLNGVVGMHYSWKASTTAVSGEEIYYSNQIQVDSTSNFPRSGWLRFICSDNLARYAYYEDKTTTSFTLSSATDEVPNVSGGVFTDGYVELVNFVDERTTISNRDYNTELGRVPVNTIPVHVSRYFILADVAINPPHGVNESVHIDIRENGGGIRTEKYEEAKKQNPKIQWFSDNGKYNGQVHPGNGAIVIKLPISIKNRFTEEQIKAIIEENIALGMVPIIRYYGYQSEITSLIPLSS